MGAKVQPIKWIYYFMVWLDGVKQDPKVYNEPQWNKKKVVFRIINYFTILFFHVLTLIFPLRLVK